MVAGTPDGKKHVDWELIKRVADNLDTSDANGVAIIWDQAIQIAQTLKVEHSAWSIAGGTIVGPTYDGVVDHTIENLRLGHQLFGKISDALRANAKLWEASEKQNIDSFTPVTSAPYGP